MGSRAGTAAGRAAGTASGPGRASVLAVDAGNSKTDVAVIGADGSVLGTARGGGFQPPVVGIEAAVDVLAEAVAEAASAAGLPERGVAEHVSACLANADLPVEERELAEAVQARGWGRTTDVRNDTFAILRAGLPSGAEPRGVAVVCGAGINCVGMLPDGRTARFPAIGRISGDWGGGSGLAEEALWFAARAEDGRGEPTGLVRTLPGHFGLASMYELIEALHLGRIPFERRHELTPVLFATSAAGDPVARSLVDRLAEEVVALSTVALSKLGLLDEEVPVLLGGSVLAARHPQLDQGIAELLAAKAPKAVIGVVTAPPVLGAGLLGLDQVRADAAAHARLGAHYSG
ncbi:N-acetylglucosamine kinase [Streptomyces odonnellii]|uniref:N-acetylglucosamine kinase n=1 Tax=Streptomyces odonnellii TaxID=1417980 RepID=UPI00099D10E0|nr:BadF/BadG/BcrA/BcrD ATPase family protein [Streptomyces odonnellii]